MIYLNELFDETEREFLMAKSEWVIQLMICAMKKERQIQIQQFTIYHGFVIDDDGLNIF